MKKKKLNRMLRDAKSHYLSTIIEGSHSSRELFRVAYEMLGSTCSPLLPSSIPWCELPDSFNTFFIDRIIKIRDDIDHQTSLLHNDPVFQGSNLIEFHSVSERTYQ
jgi:hypothetical protein